MTTDRSIRPELYADAAVSSRAASAAASAAIICAHTRELEGLDVLIGDALVADPPSNKEIPATLPLPAGHDTLAKVALGADGITLLKNSS
jgi:hypothetical protein